MSFAIVTCPDPCSKCCDNDDLLDIGTVGKEWIHLELLGVVFPVVPVFLSCFVVVIHDAIANGFPRRQDITFDAVLFGMWYSFQEVFFSGKSLEKEVVKGV